MSALCDEEGIRSSKTVNGTTTYFNTSDGRILSQSDGTNTLIFQYSEDNSPLGFMWNGDNYYYLTDSLNSVTGICDTSGNILVRYTYDEWGKLLNTFAEDNELAQINPIRYRGYYFDNETGYYYLQSRYYNPEICRFISADVVDVAQFSKDSFAGVNIFSYCSNNPVNCVDPLGMFEIGRDNFVLALDIMLDVLVPQFSGPMDIAGKAIKAMIGRTVSYSVVSKVVKN